MRTRIRPQLGRTRSAVDKVLKRRKAAAPKERKQAKSPFRARKNPIGRFLPHKPEQQDFRHGEYTHVSDLLNKCMRSVALAAENRLPVMLEPTWTSQRIIFRSGEILHELLRDEITRKSRTVFGNWRCGCKKTITEHGFAIDFKNVRCEHCGGPTNIYDEFKLINEECKIVGHADIAYMEDGWLMIGELKSVSKLIFDSLSGAQPDHQYQARMYSWLARQMGYNVHDHVVVFYVCREWMFKNPYKEYLVYWNPDDPPQPYVDLAMEFKIYRETGAVPPRTLCTSKAAPRSKKCATQVFCFMDD